MWKLLIFLGLFHFHEITGSQELQDFYSRITQLLNEAVGNDDILPAHPVQVAGKFITDDVIRLTDGRTDYLFPQLRMAKEFTASRADHRGCGECPSSAGGFSPGVESVG